MAITAFGRQQVGTLKTIKGSGGDAAITMTSVANGAARQAVKLDFGATTAQRWKMQPTNDLDTTPVAGQSVDYYMSWSDSATAGTGNSAGTTGTDAAYTGVASNLAASLLLLDYLGSSIVTADVAAQVSEGPIFTPKARYGCLVVVNNSGAAFVGNATNTKYVFRPLEDTSEPT